MAPRRKAKIKDPQKPKAEQIFYKTSAVKCALRKRCFYVQVYDAIQHDVTEMSSLAVEASRYIHYILMRNWKNRNFGPINFRELFYDLTYASTRPNPNVDPDYHRIRGNIPYYISNDRRSNIIGYLATKYETAFKNNLKMHAWKRLKAFFRKLLSVDNIPFDDGEINSTLAHLFFAQTDAQPNQTLLRSLRQHLHWNGVPLTNIDSNDYHVHIPLFYELQRFNELHRFKNFKLIPQNHFGSVHIRYDQQSMFYLLTRLTVLRCEGETKEQCRNRISADENLRRTMWGHFFKLPETRNKKFDWTFETDGVAVSFCMKQRIVNPVVDGEKFVEKVRHELENGVYTAKIGLDPGYKLMVGGVSHEKQGDVWRVKPLKLSSKEYHNVSGFTARKHLLDKWTTPERTEVSSMSEHYETYVRYQLGIFIKKQEEFSKRKVVRLKLKKYICVTKTCARIAKEIVGDHKEVFIAIGSTKFSPNSPIKGYRRVPHRKLLHELRQTVADVAEEDEFRSTMLCANCHHINLTSRSPHRYQFCPTCHTHWHRDVNGGANILYKAECRIRGIALHRNFLRENRAISDHFSYQKHKCTSAQKKDVQVPVCPLCSEPVPTPRGISPDMTVGQHIDQYCKSDKTKIFTNRCSFRGCKKKELIPVNCVQCKMNFCLRHRHSADHDCNPKARSNLLANAAMNRQSGNQSNHLQTVQGGMSEDEALAHALARSIQELDESHDRNRRNQQQQQQVPCGGSNTSSNKDKCLLS